MVSPKLLPSILSLTLLCVLYSFLFSPSDAAPMMTSTTENMERNQPHNGFHSHLRRRLGRGDDDDDDDEGDERDNGSDGNDREDTNREDANDRSTEWENNQDDLSGWEGYSGMITGLRDSGPGAILSRQAVEATVPPDPQRSATTLPLTEAAYLVLDGYIQSFTTSWIGYSFDMASTDAANRQQLEGSWSLIINWPSMEEYFVNLTDPFVGPSTLVTFNTLPNQLDLPNLAAANKMETLLSNLGTQMRTPVQLSNNRNFYLRSDNAEGKSMNFLDMITEKAIQSAYTSYTTPGSAISSDAISRALGYDVDGLGHFSDACRMEFPEAVVDQCAAVMERLGEELISAGVTLNQNFNMWRMGVIFYRPMWRQIVPPTSGVGNNHVTTLQVKALARFMNVDQMPPLAVGDIQEMLDMILASMAEQFTGDFPAAVRATLVSQELIMAVGV